MNIEDITCRDDLIQFITDNAEALADEALMNTKNPLWEAIKPL